VGKGDTIFSILAQQGFPSSVIAECIEALKCVFNGYKISPGDKYIIKTDDKGNIYQLNLKVNRVNIYSLKKEGEKLLADKETVFLDKKIVRLSGEIEDSFFGAINKLGESDQLAIDFAEIFAWDIDFGHDLQKGDQFTILVEKYYAGEEFIGYGKIKAAEYDNQGKIYRAIYFKAPDGQEGYFTPEGISVKRSFLRAPLKFNRISSGYSFKRLHPILGENRPHLGVDFVAPIGTPVFAVADGVVVEKVWKNGNGNTVRIRHPLGYETMYNHLSCFGKDIKVGSRVKQKEIIGFVGTTGLSTGPHLDYRMKRKGKFVNPLLEKFPPGFPVAKEYRNLFSRISQQMLAQLEEQNFSSPKIVTGR
ncbi:MAG: peptidoglycan DD-metalloendopeptidase family protein, partial [Desulfobacterota bacterium]|nr:peptidoglycan DD-metalloendopeptidase family protein [Thermodesulfobacteriota bacterium]